MSALDLKLTTMDTELLAVQVELSELKTHETGKETKRLLETAMKAVKAARDRIEDVLLCREDDE